MYMYGRRKLDLHLTWYCTQKGVVHKTTGSNTDWMRYGTTVVNEEEKREEEEEEEVEEVVVVKRKTYL